MLGNNAELIADRMSAIADAIEKQIPKKPDKTGETRQGINGDGENENYVSTQEDFYECPACGSFLGYVDECKDGNYQCNYCQCCGQAIDWDMEFTER